LLSVIALTAVTSWIINSGRGKYAILTIAPMLFVISTTMTAGYQLIGGRFYNDWSDGWAKHNFGLQLKRGLNIALTIFMMAAVTTIRLQAVTGWINHSRMQNQRSAK